MKKYCPMTIGIWWFYVGLAGESKEKELRIQILSWLIFEVLDRPINKRLSRYEFREWLISKSKQPVDCWLGSVEYAYCIFAEGVLDMT